MNKQDKRDIIAMLACYEPNNWQNNLRRKELIHMLELELSPTRHPRHDATSLAAYDAYFDSCETANKIPLSFDKWKHSNKGA